MSDELKALMPYHDPEEKIELVFNIPKRTVSWSDLQRAFNGIDRAYRAYYSDPLVDQYRLTVPPGSSLEFELAVRHAN